MNKKVIVGGTKHVVTLQPSQYLAAGGEAEIYVNGSMVYKLYHDPAHKQLPLGKMKELSVITNPQVVIPKELIFDPKDGKPLGYTTRYVDDVEPLLKLFTKTFKDDNNVDFQMINRLVKEIQVVVNDVHAAQCLVVDLNELNILAELKPSTVIPWFIDTDSYSTPSFKATAIMDSVRDRRVTTYDKSGTMHYNPDIGSDWFSWSVLAFWLYTNIHPYRGRHAKYKPNEKAKQMDDGISVFHPGVGVPPCVNDFKVIPARHLDYFKRVFLNGERGVPPLPDSSAPLLVPTQIITIQGTDKLKVEQIAAYADNILAVTSIMGVYYVATKTHIYANTKEIGRHAAKKILLVSASDGTLVTAQQSLSNKIEFRILTQSDPVGTAQSNEMFARNNAFYTISKGKLVESSFTAFGNKMVHRVKEVENVSTTSAKMYNGCVIQDLLGKIYLTLPYKLGSCFSKHIPQLDGYRIVDAKAERNIVVVVGEKKGQFDRIIIIFNKAYDICDVRKVDNIAYDTINFTVMDNGLCVLLASDNELELFATAAQAETLTDPPFDATMRLFATSDGIFFVNGNSFHQLKRK
jgi:hypothetical protein